MKHVWVAGSGFMGTGIAQVALEAGCRVTLYDVRAEQLDQAAGTIGKFLAKSVEKGKRTQAEVDQMVAGLSTSTDPGSAAESDLVIEAVYEDLQVKRDLFAKLDAVCPPQTILATNTSYQSVTAIAAATSRPDRVVGLHFFAPAPVMKLVEVVVGLKTSQETLATALDFIQAAGKEHVVVKDSPGFLVNRILAVMRNEALACLEEGLATPEDIDKALRLGLGHPMGPLELTDFSGLEIGLKGAQTLYEAFKDPKYRPRLVVQKLVTAGDLGRKTGRGIYEYRDGERRPRKDINL